MSTLKYKGFTGSAEFSAEDGVFFGRVLGIRSMISYAGDSVASLTDSFQSAVDSYLQTCADNSVSPEKPCSGTFNVRVGESLHRQAVIESEIKGVSLNEFVKSAVEREVNHCRLDVALPKTAGASHAAHPQTVTVIIRQQSDANEDAMLRGPRWQAPTVKHGSLQ